MHPRLPVPHLRPWATMSSHPTLSPESFITRWDGTQQAERANDIPFLNDLCDTIGVHRPPPVSGGGGDYRYERSVTHRNDDGPDTTRRINLYRRSHFALEAKQAANEAPAQTLLFGTPETDRCTTIRSSKGWLQAMLKAKGQAEGYTRDLPVEEGYPPFLIVADVGFCFDLYADFSGTGKHDAQFPDRDGHRLDLKDLTNTTI